MSSPVTRRGPKIIKIKLKPITRLKRVESKIKTPLKPIACNMVRMKHTPKKPKLWEPVVTDEMIEKFPKPRGRPRQNKELTKWIIKDQIRTIMLNEREKVIEEHRKMRLEERAARENEERERKQHREAALIEERLCRHLERREREARKYRDREHRAIMEKEKALRELDPAFESERTRGLKQFNRSPTTMVIDEPDRKFKLELGDETPASRNERLNPAQPARIEQAMKECRQTKAKSLVQAHKIKREIFDCRWAQIEAGVRREGQEKFISSLYEDLETDRLKLIHDQFIKERLRTRELLGSPHPSFEQKSREIRRQLADPNLMEIFRELNKSPKNRERLRENALELQRSIELYDMIEEDWELDCCHQADFNHLITSKTIACHPNETSCRQVSMPIIEPKYWQYNLVRVNDMDEPDYNVLLARFGSKPYYRWIFSGRQTHDPLKTYEQLEKAKKASETEYEVARQKFLQILGFHARNWYRTSPLDDRGVEVSRLHCNQGKEYIGFMRIRCGGRRADKHTPHKMQIVFHLLLGRVCFILNKRSKTINRGAHLIVDPKSTYSINCLDRNQAAYFVFCISFVGDPESPAQFKDHFDLKDDS